MKKYIAIVIFSIISFKVLLGISGYSLASNYLNYSLITIIVLGVLYFFLILMIPNWLKISLFILTLSVIIYLGSWVIPIIAMATEEVELIDKWNYENFEVRLTSRIGFSGPSYYRYDIDRVALFGLIYKDIDQVVVNYNNLENCIVDFPRTRITFDKCEFKLKHYTN